jgi:hypothetical protein
MAVTMVSPTMYAAVWGDKVSPPGKKTIREAQPPFTKMQRSYRWSRRRHWREKRRDGEVTDCIIFYALKVDHKLAVRLNLRLVPTMVKINFCSCIYCLMSHFYHIVDALSASRFSAIKSILNTMHVDNYVFSDSGFSAYLHPKIYNGPFWPFHLGWNGIYLMNLAI